MVSSDSVSPVLVCCSLTQMNGGHRACLMFHKKPLIVEIIGHFEHYLQHKGSFFCMKT